MRSEYLLLIGAIVLAGCKTAPKAARQQGDVKAIVAAEETAADAERRTEAHARYANAVLLDINEEPEKAAEEFYKAALTDPGDEDLVLEASQRLLQFKEPEKAREVLLKASKQKDAPGILFAQLGRVYAVLGKKEMAIEANRTAIRKMPTSLLGYRNLAQLYLQSNQVEEGIKVLDDAAKRRDVDAGFLVDLGELYAAYARADHAEKVKAQALEVLNRAAGLHTS